MPAYVLNEVYWIFNLFRAILKLSIWDSEIMRYSRNKVNPAKKIFSSPHVGQKLRAAPHS